MATELIVNCHLEGICNRQFRELAEVVPASGVPGPGCGFEPLELLALRDGLAELERFLLLADEAG